MVPGLGSIFAVEPLVALIEEELESPDAVEKGASWEERPPREGDMKNLSAGVLRRSGPGCVTLE